MIIHVETGGGFRGTISYVHKEHEKDLPLDKKPEVIEKNLVFGDTKEMARQMRFVAKGNTRVSKPVMHVSVSFDAKEKLTEEQRQKAVKSVLKEMGVNPQDHQFLIVKHNDTANPHYHIVLNKVDLDGKKLNLGFDGKKEGYIQNKLHVIADKIEQEQGLQRTEGRNIIYDKESEKGYRFLTADEKAERDETKKRDKKAVLSKNPNIKHLQSNVQTVIQNVLQDRSVKTAQQFKAMIESKGIDVRLTEQKKGVTGASFSIDGISVKGSKIGVKGSDIEKALTINSIYSKENDLRAYIDANTHKNSISSSIVDQAIRENMNEIKPSQNVWETWKSNPKHEELYSDLDKYAENKKAMLQQKTAFEVAKEQREGRGTNQEQSQSQSTGQSAFERMKAQREAKAQEQEQDRKRGRGR